MPVARAPRLRALPTAVVGGVEVPVAVGVRARLLGLSRLDRDEAGAGLLIPRCSSVHTFGMRFALDLHFLDRDGDVLDRRLAVGPGRFAFCGRARAILEVPAGRGEEIPRPRP